MLFLTVLLAVLSWSDAESVSFQLDLGGEGHKGAGYNLFTPRCESKALGDKSSHGNVGLSKARRVVTPSLIGKGGGTLA